MFVTGAVRSVMRPGELQVVVVGLGGHAAEIERGGGHGPHGRDAGGGQGVVTGRGGQGHRGVTGRGTGLTALTELNAQRGRTEKKMVRLKLDQI